MDNILDVSLKIVLAILVGGLVGWERASKRHSAGLRTFILITAGSTAAMLLDCCLSPDSGAAFHLLPAAVVIGVSTICVNSLLFSAKNRIRGLTTAAALWCCGIIGLALGAGFYTVGLLVFLVLLPALALLPGFENYLKFIELTDLPVPFDKDILRKTDFGVYRMPIKEWTAERYIERNMAKTAQPFFATNDVANTFLEILDKNLN